MSPTTEPVAVSIEDGVGIIELARPEKFNAMSIRAIAVIEGAIDMFLADHSVRAILVRAQGKNFCTGDDLSEVSGFNGAGALAGRSSENGHRVLRKLETGRLPVVIAVQGLALAGGLELALAGDVVFAGESSRLGDQHACFGMIPGWGGTQRLPRIVGMRRALDLMMSARWIDAMTALDWGLVNYVAPDAELQVAAMAYCRTLATRNPDGLALMKRLAREGMDMRLDDGLANETATIPAFLESDNVAEGVAAFMARREPAFR